MKLRPIFARQGIEALNVKDLFGFVENIFFTEATAIGISTITSSVAWLEEIKI